jgi:hypothetical protein
MPKANLDSTFCFTAQCREGRKRTDYYDASIIGFVLECRASGEKTFFLRYQNEYGKQCRRKIGMLGEIALTEAQKIAQCWRTPE